MNAWGMLLDNHMPLMPGIPHQLLAAMVQECSNVRRHASHRNSRNAGTSFSVRRCQDVSSCS